MLLITMGFLIVVLIYINMQRKCRDREVCAKSTSTQNPEARKPVHAGTGTSRTAKAGLMKQTGSTLYRLTFPENLIKYTCGDQDGRHYGYTQRLKYRSTSIPIAMSHLFTADGSFLLVITEPVNYLLFHHTPSKHKCLNSRSPRNILYQKSTHKSTKTPET